jgi:hypothetical protein
MMLGARSQHDAVSSDTISLRGDRSRKGIMAASARYPIYPRLLATAQKASAR